MEQEKLWGGGCGRGTKARAQPVHYSDKCSGQHPLLVKGGGCFVSNMNDFNRLQSCFARSRIAC